MRQRGSWADGDWGFATPPGSPLNPNTDYHEWKELLRAAELREAGYTTRVTLRSLLILRLPGPTVIAVMG